MDVRGSSGIISNRNQHQFAGCDDVGMRGVSMKNENKKQKLATAGENTKTLTATFIDY